MGVSRTRFQRRSFDEGNQRQVTVLTIARQRYRAKTASMASGVRR